jgi:hypothetical protein
MGPMLADQSRSESRVPVADIDFLINSGEWLNVRNGLPPSQAITINSVKRYLRNSRDLGEWVIRDYAYRGFLNAALILLSFGGAAMADSNPYKTIANQGGFAQFGGLRKYSMWSRRRDAPH